jgi:putative hydrolase of the HAD superfamily
MKGKSIIMITTIVFDIGNVLAHFGWREYLLSCGYSEELKSTISKATVENKMWKEWDRGSREAAELIEECCKENPEVESEIREFFRNIHGIVKEYDYAADLVQRLKKNGYRIYILSNYSRYTFERDRDFFEFMKHVDGGVVSYQVKHVKPEPVIYEALIDKYKINPEEAVFIDDLEENLMGAKPFGFHTILMRSYDQMISDLEICGVNIK